jgi:16S rRNA (guanine527-N7)-methyltransferase
MRVPSVRLRLVEGSTRRSTFLRAAVERCGFESHVEVVAVRAEVAGRRAELRGGHTVVVSRLFGSPAETAECASPLLGVGGYLVVSEPPSDLDESRWPSAGLDLFGLEPVVKPVVGTSSFAVFRQVRECPERFPRRVGVPGKRPLF